MSWISLASNRYKLREILEYNYADPQNEKLRFEVIDSILGLYALLSGDEYFIKKEIEIAEFLVKNFIQKTAPPYQILSDVMGLVIIADLGETDYTEIFHSIAKTKKYKEEYQKSLRLIARQMAGIEEIPKKKRKKKGHIPDEKSWFRLVKEFDPHESFSLAVTLEHRASFMLKKFILPLAFLLSNRQSKKDRRDYLRQILSWGAANVENRKNIVYERLTNPNVETLDYGFDAIELKENEVSAYCYFGQNANVAEFFKSEKNIRLLFGNLIKNWNLIEPKVDSTIWKRIQNLRDENKNIYTFVYDFENIDLPTALINKTAKSLGLEISIKDITEV